MRVLFLDCFSGISGDMTIGALCDLGVKPSAFEWELSKLDIGEFHMHFERQQRQHITGVKFSIHEGSTHVHEPDENESEPAHDIEHGSEQKQAKAHERTAAHEHDHHHHGHQQEVDQDEHTHNHEHEHAESRSYRDIRHLISHSGLSEFVKKHALGIFERIAKAEGKIHGVPVDEVSFHEVGALDSIADVICACAGIEALGIERVAASNLQEGRGWIQSAHGRFPVPAPATLEILAGIPIEQINEPFEFITPTGAAILAEFAASFGLMPPLKVEKIGYGLGTRKLANRPNVLRAVLGETEAALGGAGYHTDTITRIETNIDDLSPEITGAAVDKLLAAGALDVFLTPIQMKKNRPGVQLSVLCEDGLVSKITDMIFAETTSFGLRMDRVHRLKLDRKVEKVQTPFGEISVKVGMKDGNVIQAAPEFEDCRAASEKSGQPLRTVYDAALKRFHQSAATQR